MWLVSLGHCDEKLQSVRIERPEGRRRDRIEVKAGFLCNVIFLRALLARPGTTPVYLPILTASL